MNASRSHRKGLFALVALVAVVGFTGSVLADMGGVSVAGVGSDWVQLEVTPPEGIHELVDPKMPEYIVTYVEVNPYSNTFPIRGGGSQHFIGKHKEILISGLRPTDPSSYYIFKVEANATKDNISGEPMNPTYRQVGIVKQRVLGEAPIRSLRVTGTTGSTISVELTSFNPPKGSEPPVIYHIRIAYKAKWTAESLNETAMNAGDYNPLSPENLWKASNGSRGWVDVPFSSVVQVTFPNLSPDQPYEIVAYGFRSGNLQGERLGRATGETSGYQALTSKPACLAADYQHALRSYASYLKSIGEPIPVAVEDKERVFQDEGDDLNDGLTALLFLIKGRPDAFDIWQNELTYRSGPTLDSYMLANEPVLFKELEEEVDPKPTIFFQRGDANRSGVVDISDASRILGVLFLGQGRISCMDAADTNDDGVLDMSDAVFLLGFLFQGSKEPPSPLGVCGPDLTADDLKCGEYNVCSS